MGVQGKDRFRANDAFGSEDGAKRGLQVVRVGGHHPAQEIAPPGNFMHLKDLGDAAEGSDDPVEFPVGHLQRHEADDVVPHLFEVDLAAAVVQYA